MRLNSINRKLYFGCNDCEEAKIAYTCVMLNSMQKKSINDPDTLKALDLYVGKKIDDEVRDIEKNGISHEKAAEIVKKKFTEMFHSLTKTPND